MNGFKHFLACLNIFSFSIKTKIDENRDPNDYLPLPSKYDPSIDYDKLAWEAYYESHKGEEFAEEAKRIIDSYKIVQVVEDVKNSN